MEIRTIGIIGASRLGSGIARVTALGGYAAILEDVLPELCEQGIDEIRRMLDDAVRGSKIARQAADAAVANVTTAATVEDVCRVADLLIDALPEELELKLEIFTIFDKFAKPGAILASTTTTVAIQDLAEMTYRTEDCVGLRFAGSEGTMERLEILRARDTADAVVEACCEFARRVGMQAIVTREPAEPSATAVRAEGGRA